MTDFPTQPHASDESNSQLAHTHSLTHSLTPSSQLTPQLTAPSSVEEVVERSPTHSLTHSLTRSLTRSQIDLDRLSFVVRRLSLTVSFQRTNEQTNERTVSRRCSSLFFVCRSSLFVVVRRCSSSSVVCCSPFVVCCSSSFVVRRSSFVVRRSSSVVSRLLAAFVRLLLGGSFVCSSRFSVAVDLGHSFRPCLVCSFLLCLYGGGSVVHSVVIAAGRTWEPALGRRKWRWQLSAGLQCPLLPS